MLMVADGGHIDKLDADEVQHVHNGINIPHVVPLRGHLLLCLGIGPNRIGRFLLRLPDCLKQLIAVRVIGGNVENVGRLDVAAVLLE